MFSSAEKTNTTTAVQQKAQQQTFFRKAAEESFFGAKDQTPFFSTPIQAKLSVSNPDDPQEKEADAVADQVMRMPDISPAPVTEKEEKKLDRKEEEEIYPKIETPAISRISCKEDAIQSKQINFIHRLPQENEDAGFENAIPQANANDCIHCKHAGLIPSGIIQRRGRDPPGSNISFEQSLSSSKGDGNALSGDTRQFMESRFNADFSGVRIHTGSEARQMTSGINAQAFAHGNDIYFNEGKYSPQTQSGGSLLAHELTHTIQQGASPANTSSIIGPKSILPKKGLQRNVGNHSLQTDFNISSETSHIDRSHISRKSLKINRKETTEDSESLHDTEVQAKNELSTWHINKSGFLQTPPFIQKVDEDKELQKKGEEKKEEEQFAGHGNLIQKKTGDPSFILNTGFYQNNISKYSQNTIQSKQGYKNSSLQNSDTSSTKVNDNERERGPPVQLKKNGAELIHRSIIDDALAYTSIGTLLGCVEVTDSNATSACLLRKAQEVAMHIPGYKALRVVLRSDPITKEIVDRNGHNFIEAALDIIPGGQLLQQKLQETHLLDAAAAWIDGKIATLDQIVNVLFSRFDLFWKKLNYTDFTSPMNVIRDGANIVLGFINHVKDFAVEAGKELLKMVKDFLLDSLVSFIKEKTNAYPLLTVILKEDPITKKPVERNGTNILNALLELGGPEGETQRSQMKDTGTFAKVAGYIDEGITVFGDLYATILQNFSAIWDHITIEALMEPKQTFLSIYNIFAVPVGKVLDFVKRVIQEILNLIKDVLFKRISTEAKKVKGYYLMTVIIGKDPFTKAVIPRSAENLIHGFMSLMEGGEEQFQQMKESGAIAKTVNKVNAAVERLNMTLASVIQLFIDLWNSFTFRDFVRPLATFLRIIHKFGEPIGRLILFVVEIVKIVVVAILQLMNFPFDLINNIIAKAMLAFELIKKDPIGFLKNLLRAIKEGFMQFFSNILMHLVHGLKEWFLGEIRDAGIPIPTDFTVMGIIKWLLVVLDITIEKIWKKLEERIGKPKVDKLKKIIATAQRVASAVGEAYEFMKDVQERGFMAVMIDKVKEQLSNVWEIVLDAVKSFVMDQIIKKVTVKLLSMLDPTGIMAVVNSAIALYKAIQSFIKYLQQMLQIVNSFVEGTLQIAQGATKKAANFLEGALARGIPIVLGFFANQVGLNLSSRLKDALVVVREKVDKGLTWVVDKVVVIVEKIVSVGKAVVSAVLGWLGLKKEFVANDGNQHELYFEGSGENAKIIIKSDPMPYTNFLNNYEKELGASANEMVDINGDKKTKSAVIAEAKVVADKIEKEKRKPINDYQKEDEKANEKAKTEAINNLLDQLAKVSVPLFGNEKPKDSEINLPEGNNSNEFAKQAEAVNIYKTEKVISNGSAPTSAKHKIYDIIDNRQKGNASYYIRGHLINDNLGGPGKWSNMTALSRPANHEHESSVESKIKAAFDAGAVVRYKVKAVGNQSAKIPSDANKAEFSKIMDINKDFNLLVQIITEEKNVPAALTCEAFTRKKVGNAWVDDKPIIAGVSVLNTVEHSYSSYELGDSVPGPVVNLNTGENLEKLVEVIGYPGEKETFANNIVRFCQHKKNEAGIFFSTYKGLADYKLIIGNDPSKEIVFSDNEKAFINNDLKKNKSVKLN